MNGGSDGWRILDGPSFAHFTSKGGNVRGSGELESVLDMVGIQSAAVLIRALRGFANGGGYFTIITQGCARFARLPWATDMPPLTGLLIGVSCLG